MWVRIPGRGDFFLNERGIKPDLVKLNVAFDGAGGTVWVKDAQLLQTPLDG
jgi:hypothetical protein